MIFILSSLFWGFREKGLNHNSFRAGFPQYFEWDGNFRHKSHWTKLKLVCWHRHHMRSVNDDVSATGAFCGIDCDDGGAVNSATNRTNPISQELSSNAHTPPFPGMNINIHSFPLCDFSIQQINFAPGIYFEMQTLENEQTYRVARPLLIIKVFHKYTPADYLCSGNIWPITHDRPPARHYHQRCRRYNTIHHAKLFSKLNWIEPHRIVK